MNEKATWIVIFGGMIITYLLRSSFLVFFKK
jgi:branched-subunit amino acid transport protein